MKIIRVCTLISVLFLSACSGPRIGTVSRVIKREAKDGQSITCYIEVTEADRTVLGFTLGVNDHLLRWCFLAEEG